MVRVAYDDFQTSDGCEYTACRYHVNVFCVWRLALQPVSYNNNVYQFIGLYF